MGQNLAKTPLTGIFYGALLYFAAVFPPFSQEYRAILSAFDMPLLGYLFLLVYGLFVSLAIALALAAMGGATFVNAGILFVSMLGLQWLLPNLHQLWLGETTLTMTTADTLYTLACGAVCTLLLLVLCALLFRTPTVASAAKKEFKYKLNTVGLLIRMLVLPVLYALFYFLLWYFVGWKSPEYRAFFGGPANDPGFVPALIEYLLVNAVAVPFVLIQGVLYEFFTLLLLLRMVKSKALFIVSSALLYLSGPVQMLIPSPLLPDTVRFRSMIFQAILLLLFGVLTTLLLHSAYKKEAVAPPVAAPAKGAGAKGQPAAPVLPGGVTAKQAAGAVRNTMNRR